MSEELNTPEELKPQTSGASEPKLMTRRDFLKVMGAGLGGAALVLSGVKPADASSGQIIKKEELLSSESSPIFSPILTKLNSEYWRETGDWEGDMMKDAPSFAPRVLYKTGDVELKGKADRTVEHLIGLVDELVEQLKTNPTDTEKLKQLIYPVAMGHIGLIDGYHYYGGNSQETKTKLEVYSQGTVLLSALALIFVEPAEIDKNLPEKFPFNRIQAHSFTADACFQLGEITGNQVWDYLGTYLTDRMLDQFWTEEEHYGKYFSQVPSEMQPPKEWDQGYSLTALSEAFKFTKDQKYLEVGRQIVDTSLRHLEDKERGGFVKDPLSQDKYLSGNCAMLRGMNSWASIDSLEPARISQATAKTISFLEKDLYREGLLYHHWNPQGGRADYFCTGCNFFALSGIQDVKSNEYKIHLPIVISDAPGAVSTIVEEPDGQMSLLYNEWKEKFNQEGVKSQARSILRNPFSLMDQSGLKNVLELLK